MKFSLLVPGTLSEGHIRGGGPPLKGRTERLAAASVASRAQQLPGYIYEQFKV